MTITYILLTCGEDQIFELINYIKNHKDGEDKIMVLYDSAVSRPEFEKKLRQQNVRVVNHALGNDYSEHRNHALQYVKTDYVFTLDADEIPHTDLIEKGTLKQILKQEKPDIVGVPRLNLFEGILPVHCLTYNWTLKEGVVQWPDFQTRVFRNRKDIRFVGALHERLKKLNHHKLIYLPQAQEYSIIHRKNMDKQIADNTRYAANWSLQDNTGENTHKLLEQ